MATTLDPVPELSTAWIRGTVKGDGVPLAGSALETFTLTLYDFHTGAVINEYDGLSVLNENGGTVDENGAFAVELPSECSPIVTARRAIETHVALFMWTWPTTTPTRTGRAFFHIPVENLGRVPAEA